MKKIWKKLCVCLLVIVSSISFFACKKDNKDLSVDLDGDGVISTWETLYENEEELGREIHDSNVVEISSFAQLKAISKDEGNISKSYKLVKNINCNGEEVFIDLKDSILYGNNKYITNFKLGNVEDGVNSSTIKGLFYNGIAVYDLRVFMGKQEYTISDSGEVVIAPFVNTENISDVEIKGFINIDRKKPNNGSGSIYTSLCAGDVSAISINYSGENTGNALQKQLVKNITNVNVLGKLTVKEGQGSEFNSNIGSIISSTESDAYIYNCTSSVDMDVLSSGNANIGMIVGNNNGFVSTCSSSGNLYSACNANNKTINVGGICGINNNLAELKNCATSTNITFAKDKSSNDDVQFSSNLKFGGIVGSNYSGVVDYAISDAIISISDTDKAVVGGICGVSEYGIFDNIVSRGSVTLNRVKTINASNMVGTTKYGYIKSAIVDTPIYVNNGDMLSNVVSTINIGALTMFETSKSSSSSDVVYNAEESPHMNGVLLMGENIINADGKASVNAERGLYNKYTRKVEKTSDNSSSGESTEAETQYETKLPLIFDNVCIVKTDDTDKNYRKYKTTVNKGESSIVLQDGLKNSDGTYSTEPMTASSAITMKTLTTSIFMTFCVNDLGFRYGAGFNEVSLPTNKISDMVFTLSEDKAKTGYFNKNTKNNAYSDFDKLFDGDGGLDLTSEGKLVAKEGSENTISENTYNYLVSDQEELLSYLIYLVNNGKESYSPIVFSRKYLEAIYHCNFTRSDSTTNNETGESAEVAVASESSSQGTMSEGIDNNSLITALETHIYLRLKDKLANSATKDQDVKDKRYDLYFDEKETDGSTSGTNDTALRYIVFTLTTPTQTYRFQLDVGYLVDGVGSDYFVLYLSFK